MDLKRLIESSSSLIALLAVGVLAATTTPPTQRSVYVTAADTQGKSCPSVRA
jgi:hypothetical protein